MSFWQIFKNFGTNEKGDVINRVSDNTFISANGTTYTQIGNNVIGSNGSHFVQVGGDMEKRSGGISGGFDAQPETWLRTDSDTGSRHCFDENDDK